jgi:hypothetical protein
MHENDALERLQTLNLDDTQALQQIYSARSQQLEGVLHKQSLLNEQTASFYEQAANCCSDPGEVEKLQFLAAHFREQAAHKRALGDIQQQQQDRSSVQPQHVSDQSLNASARGNWFGGVMRSAALASDHFAGSASSSAPTATPSSLDPSLSGNSLAVELHSLFVAPWESLLAAQRSQAATGQPGDAFAQTLAKVQHNFSILMRIASMGDSGAPSAATPGLSQRLQQLQSDLSRVQLERLQQQVRELEQKLEQERKSKIKYQKEAKKNKKKWEELKLAAVEKHTARSPSSHSAATSQNRSAEGELLPPFDTSQGNE